MGTHAIQSVRAVRNMVDALRWDVRISTDFYGIGPAFVTNWEGEIGFYRDTGLGAGRMKEVPSGLWAEWTNRTEKARVTHPGEATFQFVAMLPGDALDRIERFRDGGRLFARLEGRLFPVYRDSGQEADATPWLHDLTLQMGGRRTLDVDILSQFYELTHHVWCSEVLRALRPPGRYVFDVMIPEPRAGEESAAQRAVSRLQEARETYDRGGLPGEVARSVYRALEEAKELFGPFKERHGVFAEQRLEEQRKALASMCDPERHARRDYHDELEFDRPLALHALASASSILSCLLR